MATFWHLLVGKYGPKINRYHKSDIYGKKLINELVKYINFVQGWVAFFVKHSLKITSYKISEI